MSSEVAHLVTQFFAAARALAWPTGSLQECLTDAYADHLLAITRDALPADLQPAFGALEESLAGTPADSVPRTPFQAATLAMSDDETRPLIERILMLYGRLAGCRDRVTGRRPKPRLTIETVEDPGHPVPCAHPSSRRRDQEPRSRTATTAACTGPSWPRYGRHLCKCKWDLPKANPT